MPTLADVRAQIPDLSGLDDDQAVDALHQAYYPDLTREQVAESLGVKPQVKTEKSGLIRRAVGDTGISLVKGAIGVPEAAVGLADLVTGGQAGKVAEDLGFRPKEARAALDEYLSPEQQAANKAVQDAHGVVDIAKAAITNPSVVVQNAIESVPSMLGGGLLARGAMRLIPRMAGFAAAGIGEGAVSAGQNAEQVRQETPDGLLTGKQSLILTGSGFVTGGISAIAGKVSNKLGIGDIDTMIAGGLKSAPNHVQKSFVREMLEGAASEGVLEELPQSVQEQVAQNWALGKPLDEGVDQAAVLGMFAGGLMGGGAQVVHGHAPHVEEVGTLSRAANIGIDANTEIARPEPVANPSAPVAEPIVMPAGMPSVAALAARGIEPGMDALHQAGARDAQELRQWDRSAPEEAPAAPAEPDTWQPGDLLNKQGAPFTNKGAALRAQKAHETPDAYTVQDVQGGFVLRPTTPAAPVAVGDVSRGTEVVSQPDVAAIDTAAHQAAESPHNDLREPTDAQKEAGNYVKGHVRIDGMDVSIENPKGSTRRSKADDPNPWQVEMPAHYGYIRGTTGADGDHVDLTIGPKGDNGRYWVINQHHAGEPTRFDEHKLFTGVESADEAVSLYKASFANNFGDKVFTSISDELSPDELKAKLPGMNQPKPVEPTSTTPTQAIANEPNAEAGADPTPEAAPQAAPEAAAVPAVAATESAGPATAGPAAVEPAGVDEMGARWTRSTEVERHALLSDAGWLGGMSQQRLARQPWDKIKPTQQARIAAGMKPATSPSAEAPVDSGSERVAPAPVASAPADESAPVSKSEQAPKLEPSTAEPGRTDAPPEPDTTTAAVDGTVENIGTGDTPAPGTREAPQSEPAAAADGGRSSEEAEAGRPVEATPEQAASNREDAVETVAAVPHESPAANDEPAAAPRPENVIELRKRASVLESLRKCLAA